MTRSRRILVSTFGSAGDLFPLMPALLAMQARGDEVLVATRRGIGLYLRAAGIATIALGDGSEMRVVHDPKMFSTRFDGWESWRRTVTAYVAPTLRTDADAVEAAIREWRPDAIVCSGFAAAARAAARRAGRTPLEVSIYPQHVALAASPARFAAKVVAQVDREDRERGLDPGSGPWLWGAPPDVLLHDRVLLGAQHSDQEPIGSPRGTTSRPVPRMRRRWPSTSTARTPRSS